MNGAEALLRTLAAGGVDVCFANPGTSEMHIMAAFGRVPQIRCILGLYEGVVTGAADGFARMARSPAATLMHLGPGIANGLANLHNARKGRVPIVNIVGEHPAYHRLRDTPLASDIAAIAAPFSDWLRTSEDIDSLSLDAARAVAAARTPPGGIATLIVPADVAWSEGGSPGSALAPPPPRAPVDSRVARAIALLRSGLPTAMILGGEMLYGAGLVLAGRIAAASGASLLTPFPLTRMERGRGRPEVRRLPYVAEQAIRVLESFQHFILVGAVTPFAYFAHPDQDAVLIPPDREIFTLTAPGDDHIAALEAIAFEMRVPQNPAVPERPGASARPTGPITPQGVAETIAALLPEQAIVVDEGMTAGRTIMASCRDSAPHDWLGNTGGSIGIGLPLAVGAAVAAPERPVLCLSADGSAMYTLQALWTMAHEGLGITTVIFANRAYALLQYELRRITGDGAQASAQFELQQPNLDFVALAKGMGVTGKRVDSLDGFAQALVAGLTSGEPNLIEVPL